MTIKSDMHKFTIAAKENGSIDLNPPFGLERASSQLGKKKADISKVGIVGIDDGENFLRILNPSNAPRLAVDCERIAGATSDDFILIISHDSERDDNRFPTKDRHPLDSRGVLPKFKVRGHRGELFIAFGIVEVRSELVLHFQFLGSISDIDGRENHSDVSILVLHIIHDLLGSQLEVGHGEIDILNGRVEGRREHDSLIDDLTNRVVVVAGEISIQPTKSIEREDPLISSLSRWKSTTS